MRTRKAYFGYVVAFLVVLLLPLAAMPFTDSSATLADAEKRDLAGVPSLTNEDGTPNEDWLSGLGAYFEDHFAFRDRLITANAAIRQASVGSDPGDEVILGKNGWLYYSGTRRDYLGRELMNDRELFDLAHNMRLIQDYAQDGRESDFLLVIAANKNSLYPENMPDNLVRGSSRNAENLRPYLDAAGVRYLDMSEELADQEGLYFERDTHWNGKGALQGYSLIMSALEEDYETYADVPFEQRADHQGDLDEMAFPSAWSAEMDYYLQTNFTYKYVGEEPQSMRDPFIETECDTGAGSLFMFRDSFADALIPLLSQEFQKAWYSMYTPYDLGKARSLGASDVVVEIVERNLLDLISRPAVFESPQAELILEWRDATGVAEEETTRARAEVDGRYVLVSGTLDPALVADRAELVAQVGDVAYVPFYTSNTGRSGTSFYACVPDEGRQNLPVRVFAQDGQEWRLVLEKNVTIQDDTKGRNEN